MNEKLREAAECALECLELNGFGKAYAEALLRAALSEPDSGGWVRTADELPPCGQKVIAHYINELGKRRTVMAHYIPPLTVKCCDFYDPDSEYDEDFVDGEDEGYVRESWHELIENWDEYSGCEISQPVTHWMSAPDYPEVEES